MTTATEYRAKKEKEAKECARLRRQTKGWAMAHKVMDRLFFIGARK